MILNSQSYMWVGWMGLDLWMQLLYEHLTVLITITLPMFWGNFQLAQKISSGWSGQVKDGSEARVGRGFLRWLFKQQFQVSSSSVTQDHIYSINACRCSQGHIKGHRLKKTFDSEILNAGQTIQNHHITLMPARNGTKTINGGVGYLPSGGMMMMWQRS